MNHLTGSIYSNGRGRAFIYGERHDIRPEIVEGWDKTPTITFDVENFRFALGKNTTIPTFLPIDGPAPPYFPVYPENPNYPDFIGTVRSPLEFWRILAYSIERDGRRWIEFRPILNLLQLDREKVYERAKVETTATQNL